MNSLWSITVEDYEEVIRRARESGLSPGDSMEDIFLAYMKEKVNSHLQGTNSIKRNYFLI